VLVGLLVSGAVETTQALFLAQRSPQVADVVSNTLDAALGATIAMAVRWRRAVDFSD